MTPLANEDIASPCHTNLTIAAPERVVSVVWVIYDRGRDVHAFYSDPSVVALARRLHLALLVLFTALNQFAAASGHRELVKAKLIRLGFSGVGPLCTRIVSSAPSRIVAAILSSPEHYEPYGIDTVHLNPDDWVVPELILAGGHDDVSGTARFDLYFRQYRDLGAAWVFVVQNNSPHCYTANAKNHHPGVAERQHPTATNLAIHESTSPD